MESLDYLNTIENLCIENGKLQAIIESSTNGIIEVDREGNLLSSNPAFYQMINISPAEDKVYSLSDLLSSPSLKKDLGTLLSEKEDLLVKGFHITVPQQEREEMRYLEIKFSRVPVMNNQFIIGIVKDKSDIVRALANREEYIRTLLDIIHELRIDNRDTIYHIASLVELRDHTTGRHLERVEHYTRALAYEYMNRFGNRDSRLTDDYIDDMAISSILHDIGKVAISDVILQKPERLSKSEFESIKEHTIIAGEALKEYKGRKDFLAMGREIATYHHEKWDGSGYPMGLKGKKIPLSARIVALCDTYDALVSERPYKKAYNHDKALEIIVGEKGLAFDPDIVDIFVSINREFLNIKLKYKDN